MARCGIWMLLFCLIVICGAQQNHSEDCSLRKASVGERGLKPVLTKRETALLLLLGFGGVSALLAFLYMALRRYIFHDADNLDTAFDAGGQVSMSLTAVTVATQFTWPGDILQTPTVTVRAGIAAPFYWAAANLVGLLLFPILSVKFKIRCPGAKTYLQVIHARFGRLAHLHYTIFALMLNIIILFTLIVSSRATIQAFTNDASDEFVVFIMATLFGSYSFIGGLGSTFYVSYINAVVLAITISALVIKVFFSSTTEYLGLGDIHKMYETLACLHGPDSNYNNSFMTFFSQDSISWGLVLVFMASAVALCDQATWQSRIAAKPNDGVWGFIFANAIYFVIPSAVGTTSGLAYLVISSQNGTHLLSDEEIDIGLITPVVAQTIFGDGGAYLVLTMTTMALMATGSGEVMAISSILVYDIYQIHIKPFRKRLEIGMCIMCGLLFRDGLSEIEVDQTGTTMAYCSCPTIHDCPICCHANTQDPDFDTETLRTCPTHGALRRYQDQLLSYKSRCILFVALGLVPFGLLVLSSGMSVNWTYLYGTSIMTISIPGVLLSILWSRTTKLGLISGGIMAMAGSISANLAVASTYDGGIDGGENFFKNSVELNSVLGAAATSLGIGFVSIICVSFFTSKSRSSDDAETEWEKTRNIDNPLHPWADRFQEDFPDLKPGQRPSNLQMETHSRRTKLSAYIGAGVSLVIVVFVIPGIMYSFPVLNFDQFQGWVYSGITWAFMMVIIVIVIAPVQETVHVYQRYRRNNE